MTPETIHSKLDGVVSGVTSTRSFFNNNSGKSTEQQNRMPCITRHAETVIIISISS